MNSEPFMQLPEDCLKGNIVATLYGQKKIRIENYKGIVSYTSEVIRIFTRKRIFRISGKNLEIQSMNKDEIEITGWIEKMEYDQG